MDVLVISMYVCCYFRYPASVRKVVTSRVLMREYHAAMLNTPLFCITDVIVSKSGCRRCPAVVSSKSSRSRTGVGVGLGGGGGEEE